MPKAGCKLGLPPFINEGEFLRAVDDASNLLAKSFAFGYYDEDDMRQQAYLFALEASWDKYDPKRPLANFLYSHIKNRFINFKRDKFHRNDPPCTLCSTGTGHEGGALCKKYMSWRDRNASKRNLMRPDEFEEYAVPAPLKANSEYDMIDIHEVDEMIDIHLPVELRSIYLRLKSGDAVSKSKRELLLIAIRGIVSGGND